MNRQERLPSFNFADRDKPVSWDRLRLLDLERVQKKNDVSTVMTFLDDIALGLVDDEEADPVFMKTMTLAQMSAQYVVACNTSLKSRLKLVNKAVKTFTEEEDFLDAEIMRYKAKEKALKREMYEYESIKEQYITLLRELDPTIARKYHRKYEKRTVAREPKRKDVFHRDTDSVLSEDIEIADKDTKPSSSWQNLTSFQDRLRTRKALHPYHSDKYPTNDSRGNDDVIDPGISLRNSYQEDRFSKDGNSISGTAPIKKLKALSVISVVASSASDEISETNDRDAVEANSNSSTNDIKSIPLAINNVAMDLSQDVKNKVVPKRITPKLIEPVASGPKRTAASVRPIITLASKDSRQSLNSIISADSLNETSNNDTIKTDPVPNTSTLLDNKWKDAKKTNWSYNDSTFDDSIEDTIYLPDDKIQTKSSMAINSLPFNSSNDGKKSSDSMAIQHKSPSNIARSHQFSSKYASSDDIDLSDHEDTLGNDNVNEIYPQNSTNYSQAESSFDSKDSWTTAKKTSMEPRNVFESSKKPHDYDDDDVISIEEIDGNDMPGMNNDRTRSEILNFVRANNIDDSKKNQTIFGSTFKIDPNSNQKPNLKSDSDDIVLLATMGSTLSGDALEELSPIMDSWQRSNMTLSNKESDNEASPSREREISPFSIIDEKSIASERRSKKSTVLESELTKDTKDEDLGDLRWRQGRASLDIIEEGRALDILISLVTLSDSFIEKYPKAECRVALYEMVYTSKPVKFERNSNLEESNVSLTSIPTNIAAHLILEPSYRSTLKRRVLPSNKDKLLQLSLIYNEDFDSEEEEIAKGYIDLTVMIEDSCNIIRQEIELMTSEASEIIGSATVDVRGYRLFT